MCGIAGICSLDGPRPIPLDSVKRMMGAQTHRGPDETGLYVDDRVALGHNRLSIIDLAGGSQPIHNEDETLWIVYNGEIFNYVELRRELLDRGHRFYTSSDTEVILHLYEEKGPACLQALNGQFAFAIWDSRARELFIARDRMGIRPVHYAIHDGRLLFASEIKAIFAAGSIDRGIDPIAIDQVFTFWTTLNERTVFTGVKELPPGHCLRLADGRITVERYWSIPFRPVADCEDRPLGELAREVRELLDEAIRIRLRADVPIGCYLSGGLDSSAVTARVKRRASSQLRTFGIRFEEGAFDEGPYQQAMVDFLGVDHTALEAGNEQIGSTFAEVLWHCEKPLLRTAPVPLFLLSRVVRDSGLKVVLTGEGADEVFGGYNIFREAKVRRFWAREPRSTCRPLLLGKLYPYVFKDARSRQMLQSFFGVGLNQPDDPLFSHLVRWQNTSRTKVFFSQDLRASVRGYNGYEEVRQGLPDEYGKWDVLSKSQFLEMAIFLSNYLLSSQGDRVAMAHSVEIRLPYLDVRVIEFMGRVAPRWKIAGLNEKFLLKEVFRSDLPREIVERPKHPYRAPIRECLFNAGAQGSELLSEASLKAAGLFDPAAVGRLLRKCESGRGLSEMDGMALAGMVSTQIVHAQFVAGFPWKDVVAVEPDLFVDRRTSRTIRRGGRGGRREKP